MQSNMTLSQKIQVELVKLLYQQIIFGLWAESVAAISLVMVLRGAINSYVLLIWLALNLSICGLGRYLLVYAYRREIARKGLDCSNIKFWVTLFAIGAFLSGLSWGAVGSVLMVKHDIVRETFQVFLLMGVTAAANALYSPSRRVYALFLIPAFGAFTVWLFIQGGVFIILGILAMIYIFLMLMTSFYSHKLITTSLYLRFKNLGLIDNLSQAKNKLENKTNELEKTLSLVRATLESTTDGILVVDSENKIEDFNHNFLQMWRIHSEAALIGQNIKKMVDLIKSELVDPLNFIEIIENSKIHPDEKTFDEITFKDGRIFERYSHPQRIGDKSVGRVWSFRDVTGRKNLESKLYHQANYDLLTGLPNRALLLERIATVLDNAKHDNLSVAVLFLDIDRFKFINDTLGHSIGDKLLKATANRLLKCIDRLDTVSREGGDEFIVIIHRLENEADVIEIAACLLNAIREPFIVEGHKLNITMSIGISFYSKDGEDPDKLIRNADIAMYYAKQLGRNNFQFFTEEMNNKVLQRLVMENQLRNALEQNEFSIQYQPIINIKTGYIIAIEALLRWKHPRLVSIPTPEFIELAEETGVIVPIGEWVFRNACMHAKKCQTLGFSNLQIAVNFSGRQFKQADFVDRLAQIVTESGADPHCLALEITESVIMDNVDKTINALNRMKKMGITIIIDDFGTGYSSLSYLKRLPVDKLKIDRSFVQDLPYHVDDAAITTAILALAGKLNLKVVAEGVEKFAQLNFLIEQHCDEMQGFYFSGPLDAEDCIKLLEKNRQNPFTIPKMIITE